jgi:hypothetical protein
VDPRTGKGILSPPRKVKADSVIGLRNPVSTFSFAVPAQWVCTNISSCTDSGHSYLWFVARVTPATQIVQPPQRAPFLV